MEIARKKSFPSKKWLLICLGIILFIVITSYSFWKNNEGKEERQIVSAFMEAYTQNNEKKCKELISDENTTMSEQTFSDFQKETAKRVTYQILGFSQRENYSVVELKITNVDFRKMMDVLLESGKTIEETQFEYTLQNMLSDSEIPRREFECEVNVRQIEGEYKVEITESLSNALLAGVPEYIASLVREK